ncbi:hypothetical protein TSAR_000477 [Trichomalopsis sarcophagae]|uniref:phospholipase A1 n=1 Tax=Trichomalopsis sarcophagae TaxID=543379 RepID=A0A232F124_9HYME|nr:hypothetical protein TSAR_000477 [Trichomalopsis sarcophagae]
MHKCAGLFWICVGVFLSSSLCLCDALLFDQLDALLNSERLSDGMEKIRMIHYKRSSNEDVEALNYSLAQSEELMENIDSQKPYVLYIHGYEEHPANESIQTVVSAYIQRGTDNIVVLDWSAFAFGNYVSVAARIKDISKCTAKALGNLAAAGLNVDTLHVIGHSLGAQVAGFIDRHLDFSIPRVTGLDPANPLFYQFGAEHVDERSGQQVDIVHTDGGIYGAYEPTGSVDFYANGGIRPQPGCFLFGVPLSPRSLCSHWRSWRFYAESVINDKAFPALECGSQAMFLTGGCKENRIVYFGYSMPKNVSGKYFFTTNARSPFGKGLAGLRGTNA